jgi:transposase
MSRSRRIRYTPEFKAEAIRLVQTTERPIKEIAKSLGVTAKTLHDWLRALRPVPTERLTEEERTELHRLRRENAQLQMERDILKKATACFARESK